MTKVKLKKGKGKSNIVKPVVSRSYLAGIEITVDEQGFCVWVKGGHYYHAPKLTTKIATVNFSPTLELMKQFIDEELSINTIKK